MRTISKELAKQHDVTVFTTCAISSTTDSKERVETKDGFQTYYFPRTARFTNDLVGQFNFSIPLMKALENRLQDFDVVHVHSYQQFSEIAVHHYAKKYGIPYILQPHGSVSKIGKRIQKTLYDDLFGAKVLSDASKIIALSSLELRQLASIGVEKEKVRVVPNSIDLFEAKYSGNSGDFKKQFCIPDDEKIVLYLGRIHVTKGIDLLVQAFAYMIGNLNCTKVTLVIAGPDDGHLKTLRTLANSLGVEHRIVFTGFIGAKQKMSALKDAYVFVTPIFYGFPMTFLESCSIGLPIITTDSGDILDWINGNVGLTVQSNVKDLAEAIFKLVNNEDLHTTYSNNCIAFVRANFSVQKAASDLTSIYKELITS